MAGKTEIPHSGTVEKSEGSWLSLDSGQVPDTPTIAECIEI